jgi:MFS family permease
MTTTAPLAPAPAAVDSRRAWRSVAAAFTSMFAVFGVAYSFGAFFEPMADELGSGRGATSLVFSITAFTYFLLGAVSGLAVDRFGPRPVLLVGATVMGAGLLLTSQVDSIVVGYATYGVGVGVGVACGYVPMVAVVGGWFERRRSTALGVAVAGVGLGTVVAAPVAARLIDLYGWRTGYVVLAAASTALLLLAAALAERPPVPAASAVARSLGQAVRTPAFASLYFSAVLLSLALFQVFVYLPDFAEDDGASEVAAAGLVAVVAAASIVGRLVHVLWPTASGAIRTYRACFAGDGRELRHLARRAVVPLAVVFAPSSAGPTAASWRCRRPWAEVFGVTAGRSWVVLTPAPAAPSSAPRWPACSSTPAVPGGHRRLDGAPVRRRRCPVPHGRPDAGATRR